MNVTTPDTNFDLHAFDHLAGYSKGTTERWLTNLLGPAFMWDIELIEPLENEPFGRLSASHWSFDEGEEVVISTKITSHGHPEDETHPSYTLLYVQDGGTKIIRESLYLSGALLHFVDTCNRLTKNSTVAAPLYTLHDVTVSGKLFTNPLESIKKSTKDVVHQARRLSYKLMDELFVKRANHNR